MGGPATPLPSFTGSSLGPPQPSKEKAGFPLPIFLLREDLGSGLGISAAQDPGRSTSPQHPKVLVDTKVGGIIP